MNFCKQLSPLVAAQQALAERQLVVLREWLGEDHELLQRCRFAALARVETKQPHSSAELTEEVSA